MGNQVMMEGNHTLASDVVSEEECFSELVHLQREGSGACETVFRKGQGRGKKLVTEDPKPVGSGRFRVPSQDSSWVLGLTWSSSFPLRQGPHLGSSSHSKDLSALKGQTAPPSVPGHHALCQSKSMGAFCTLDPGEVT